MTHHPQQSKHRFISTYQPLFATNYVYIYIYLLCLFIYYYLFTYNKYIYAYTCVCMCIYILYILCVCYTYPQIIVQHFAAYHRSHPSIFASK
jgi:hypothetical protein